MLQAAGYKYSETTFDDLFVKSFYEAVIEGDGVSDDESEEREDDD